MDTGPEIQSIRALSAYVVGSATLGDTLTRVVEAAVDVIAPAAWCGLTMRVDRTIETPVFTAPAVPLIDRAQYDAGDGPCLEAFESGEVVHVLSTAGDPRFPAFRALAREHGIGSVLSIPLQVEGEVIAAMNLYAHDDGAFLDVDLETATTFAHQAAFVLVNARDYWDSHLLSSNLREAMRSRATIEQAKGIIMATTGVGPDDAFRQLVEQSQHENVKVRDLAEELVRRAERGRI